MYTLSFSAKGGYFPHFESLLSVGKNNSGTHFERSKLDCTDMKLRQITELRILYSSVFACSHVPPRLRWSNTLKHSACYRMSRQHVLGDHLRHTSITDRATADPGRHREVDGDDNERFVPVIHEHNTGILASTCQTHTGRAKLRQTAAHEQNTYVVAVTAGAAGCTERARSSKRVMGE